MEMENKTTKLRIVIHTLYKKGYNFQKEKSAIIFFSRILNFHAKKKKQLCLPGRYIHFASRRVEKWIYLPAGYFASLQNWNNVEIRVLTRLLILLKME